MGSTGDKQEIGNSSYPLEGSTDDGSTWSTRSWGAHWTNKDQTSSTGNGGPYGTDSDSNGMTFWDTRNSFKLSETKIKIPRPRRLVYLCAIGALVVAGFFIARAAFAPAGAVTASAVSTTIVVNTANGATFAPPPANASRALTVEQAYADYAQVPGGPASIPAGYTTQLGLVTEPSGPADAPGAANEQTVNGVAYVVLNELAYSYSATVSCPPSTNPFVTNSPGASCIDWIFVDANTGQLIFETWQPVG